ncbi:hypothetical protein MNEG_2428, partial [Monoraphidium neglectum]
MVGASGEVPCSAPQQEHADAAAVDEGSSEVEDEADEMQEEQETPGPSRLRSRSILRSGPGAPDPPGEERVKHTVSWNDFQGRTLTDVK